MKRSLALVPLAVLVLGVSRGAAQTEPMPTAPPVLPGATEPAPAPSTAPVSATATAPATPRAPATAPARSAPSPQFFRLAVQTESAFGVDPGPFYNHLLGARLDRCVTEKTCFGGYVGYANLKGQAGRTNNVLMYALLEHRLPLGASWFIPLRVATGYLPKNGPFSRISAGLGVRSANIEATFELVAPTLWVSGDEPVVSLDLAAEVALRF